MSKGNDPERNLEFDFAFFSAPSNTGRSLFLITISTNGGRFTIYVRFHKQIYLNCGLVCGYVQSMVVTSREESQTERSSLRRRWIGRDVDAILLLDPLSSSLFVARCIDACGIVSVYPTGIVGLIYLFLHQSPQWFPLLDAAYSSSYILFDQTHLL
jgi:hypothetical protein